MIKLTQYGLSELLGRSGEHLFRRLHGLNIGLHCFKGINQRVDLEIQKRPNGQPVKALKNFFSVLNFTNSHDTVSPRYEVIFPAFIS